jgi:hypothetical protein
MIGSFLFLVFNLAIFYVIYLACKEDKMPSSPNVPLSPKNQSQVRLYR